MEFFQFLMTSGPKTRPMTRLTMKLRISILNIHITSFQNRAVFFPWQSSASLEEDCIAIVEEFFQLARRLFMRTRRIDGRHACSFRRLDDIFG